MPAKHHTPPSSSTYGFTLIELSIVLVIIALVAGGTVAAFEIRRNAQLLAILSDKEKYASAIEKFRVKYNALPGDMTNAETIWGSDTSCPNTTANSTGKTATCNGNGNSRVADDVSGTENYEMHRFWQQLSNSTFIEGKFSGTTTNGANTNYISPGVNGPILRLKNATFRMRHNYRTSSDTNNYTTVGHALDLCNFDSATCAVVITGREAQALDAKADDGLPAKGNIMTWKPAYMSCSDNSDENVARYVQTDNTTRCALRFMLGF